MTLELLSPAGELEALKAAVQNGANAVYFGARGFNARKSAANFDGDALYDAINYCHDRGVYAYITLNTIVREDEMSALSNAIIDISRAGADAFIVQDLGVASMVRELAPNAELHASTQMAVHNAQGVEFLRSRGFSRVVLAREMQLSEIYACASIGVRLEAFIHGALCVSCSGQCLFSSIVGGRSGNRGMCAQPCRLKYELDGHSGYLLSTKDLCTIERLNELISAGVTSFKIEGRLKRPEYVAIVTRAYREALDGLHEPTPEVMNELKQIFNRGGFTRGYVNGYNDSDIVFHERPNNMGVTVGACVKHERVKLYRNVRADDALVLRGVEDVPVKLEGNAGEACFLEGARQGDTLIRLVSAEQLERAAASYNGEHVFTHLTAKLTLMPNTPAELILTDGVHIVRQIGGIIETANNKPLDEARVREQLKKTGGTPYIIDDIELDADNNAFVPVSQVNALRREALAELTRLRREALSSTRGLRVPADIKATSSLERSGKPRIHAQGSDVKTLIRALNAGADEIVFMPNDMRKPALDAAIEALDGRKFMLCPPPVMTSKTLSLLNGWANEHAERINGVYLSNVSQLPLAWAGLKYADFMLNIANRRALDEVSSFGVSVFSPSIELNVSQISALGACLSLPVYGRIPLMQLRHCPYRAVTGATGAHADCRMCDKRETPMELTDRRGVQFPLRRIASDDGCVIQVLNSVPLMALRRIDRLPKAYAWQLMLGETDPVEALIEAHITAANGGDPRSLDIWGELDAIQSTTAHYFRGVE